MVYNSLTGRRRWETERDSLETWQLWLSMDSHSFFERFHTFGQIGFGSHFPV